MADYALLKLVHLLLFAYWLGTDVAVLYAGRLARDSAQSLDARRMAMRIMVWVEQMPRYCLVLMLPVGYTLARELGWVRLPTVGLWALWGIALAWLWLVRAMQRQQGAPAAKRLHRIDVGWRVLLTGGLLWDALQGLRGEGHILVDWLSIKFALFAALVACSAVIRVFLGSAVCALQKVLAQGSTQELELRVARGFGRAQPIMLASWGLLLGSALLGILKP